MATELQRSARLRVLRERLDLKGYLSEGDRQLLQQLEQMASRLEAAKGEFHVANILNSQGAGRLDVTWGDVVFQLGVVKAREIAWMLLEAASVAETESMLARFLYEEIKVDPDRAASVISLFRQYRRESDASLLVEKGNAH